jgi:threonine synthase
MDIQVASNFERFLYYRLGGDAARVIALMERFRSTGACAVPQFAGDAFTVSRCPDEEIPGVIRRVYGEFGYIVDPHTACAFADVRGDRPAVVLATASPAKFPETIRAAIGVEPTHPLLEAVKARPVLRQRLPADPAAIRAYIAAHAA